MANPSDPENWQRLDSLFANALDRSPDERRSYVREAAGDDEELYGEVCTLLDLSAKAERELGEFAIDLAAPLLQALPAEPASEPVDALIGQQIGPYLVQEEIGRGGMGVVYRATDVRLDRVVALKFLPPYLSSDKEAKRRFITEARAASATEHPNVATLYEIGETADGQTFLVLAYYDGESLKQRIERGPLTPSEALDVARQIASGLAATHSRGIVHCDIKPGNVLLTSNGWVRVLDFGVAKMAGGDATGPGVRLGTLSYMSPEQIKDEGVDARSDIWSLGVVLHEMLTGERPFRGERDETVLHAILHAHPAGLAPGAPGIPEYLKPVVGRALAKDPSQRYSTAEELLLDLERAATGQGPEPDDRITARPSSVRRRWHLGMALAIALVLGATGWGLLRDRWAGDGMRVPATLAVLPFSDLGGDQEAYFSEGIAEDVLMLLSGFADLRVTSRTSVMQYRGTTKSIGQIAEELGVEHVLEGSVQRDGNRLRIHAKLIDARRDEPVWAQTFDREIAGVFAVQAEIAERIAAALHAELSPAERQRLAVIPTEDLAAYDLYLQGLDYLNRYRREDNEVAIALFRQAVEADPSFALANARLGAALALKVFQFGDTYSWVDSALVASRRSLELDPDLAGGHLALGLTYLAWERYEEALEAFQRTAELAPNSAGAMINTGVVMWRLGRYDEALPWYRRALAFGPVDQALALSTISGVYAFLGLFDRSREAVERALAIQPDLPLAYLNAILLYVVQEDHAQAVLQAQHLLTTSPGNARAWASAGTAYQFSGDLEQARMHFERAYEISPASFDLLWRSVDVLLGHELWQAGERERAREHFAAFEARARDQIVSGNEGPFLRYNLAAVHAVEGRSAEAIRLLDEAVARGRREYLFLSRDPLFENLRGDERFERILATNRAEMERQRTRVVRSGL